MSLPGAILTSLERKKETLSRDNERQIFSLSVYKESRAHLPGDGERISLSRKNEPLALESESLVSLYGSPSRKRKKESSLEMRKNACSVKL